MPVIQPAPVLDTPTQLVDSALQPVGTIKPAPLPWVAGANRFEYSPTMSDADASNPENSMTVSLFFSGDGGLTYSKASYLWTGGLVDRDGITPSRPSIALNVNPLFPVTHVQIQADIHAPIVMGVPVTFVSAPVAVATPVGPVDGIGIA